MSRFVTDTLDGIEVIRDKNVEKHAEHDQSTHGSWAGTNQSVATTTSQSYSKEEINALLDYTLDSYYSVNTWLRNQDSLSPGDRKTLERTQPKKVELLDSVFEKVEPSKTEQQVFRGVSGDIVTRLLNTPVGSTFVDNGYVSTTDMIQIAHEFTKIANPTRPSAILSITAPTGTKVLRVSKLFPDNPRSALELESVLPRGTKFEITGKTSQVVPYLTTSPVMTVIEARVVPNE